MRGLRRGVWWGFAILVALLATACASSDDDDDDSDGGDDDQSDDDDDGGSPHVWTDPDEECLSVEDEVGHTACRSCVIQCNLSAENQKDLSSGPCISEQIEPGWACDVVHSPPIAEDDLADNQCAQYPEIVPHIINVDTACRFVQAL